MSVLYHIVLFPLYSMFPKAAKVERINWLNLYKVHFLDLKVDERTLLD